MRDFTEYSSLFTEYLQIEKNVSPYTLKFYHEDLKEFFVFLERESVGNLKEVDAPTIRVYLTHLYNRQLSRKSVSRKISTLRSFYKFLQRENLIEKNPLIQISLPKENKTIPTFLYKEEIEKLFEINDLSKPLGQRNQALIETLYGTGIRVGELEKLTIQDIDFTIGTMFIRGKGNKERYVPFGSFAEIALETYLTDGRVKLMEKSNVKTDAVFLNAKGRPLTARGVRFILNKMMKEAALTVHIHPHKLRHTFATHMLNEGADLRVVQELLGHENLTSTQIYTHVTKDYLREVYMNSHPRAKD